MFIKEVCSQYITTELPHKMATHSRKESALVGKRSAKKPDTGAPGASKRKQKSATSKNLNLLTYKYHALKDYPDQIANFGTMNNTNTQTVRVLS